MINKDNAHNKRTFCERCGTCCVRGGPVLHTQNHRQAQEGILTYEHLLTLRAGEVVAETVQQDGGLVVLKKKGIFQQSAT